MKFLANKLNMFSIATLLGKSNILPILDSSFPYETTLEGKTLVEKCMETGDTISFDQCLDKIV